MSIACTFPGKFGDLLWALPTVRAISETYGEPVYLVVSQMLATIVPLLKLQPYIRDAVSLSDWAVQNTAPMSPRVPPFESYGQHDRIFHLGYEGWPLKPLPHEVAAIAYTQYPGDGISLFTGIDLQRPWITINDSYPPIAVAVGFTDEHFELKYGIWSLLSRHRLAAELGGSWLSLSGIPGSRWNLEGGHVAGDWIQAAADIKHSTVFLGCCSALHVLSAALGKPTVVMEPNPHRHHPIFWPYGIENPNGRVVCVTGGDGQPTFDARHTFETVQRFL